MAWVYILQSETTSRFYIGSATDVEQRLIEHNLGKNKSTKFTGPYKLVFKQEYFTIRQARQIEYKLKKFKSRKIIEKIILEGNIKLES